MFMFVVNAIHDTRSCYHAFDVWTGTLWPHALPITTTPKATARLAIAASATQPVASVT